MAEKVNPVAPSMIPGSTPEVIVATAVSAKPAAPTMSLGLIATGPHEPAQLVPHPLNEVAIYITGPHSVPVCPLPVTLYPFTDTMLALTMFDVSTVDPDMLPMA